MEKLDNINRHVYLLVFIKEFPTDKVIVDSNNGIDHTYDIHSVEWETQRWSGDFKDVIVFFGIERDRPSKILCKLYLPWKNCIKNQENISRVKEFREKFLL